MSALQGRQFPRGICPACGRDTAIRADGQPRAHRPCLVPDDEPTERQAVNEDDGLREGIAREYAEFQDGTAHPPDWQLENGDDFAAGLLALPEVTALRAQAAAVQRVREALDALSRETGAYEAGYKGWAQQVIRQVRAALTADWGSTPS